MRFQSKLEAFLFYLGLLVMSFFVMAQPAQASGSVSISNSSYSVNFGGCSGLPTSLELLDCANSYMSAYSISCSITFSPPQLNCTGPGGWHNTYPVAYTSGGCPANSTGTTSCICNSGFKPSEDAKSCVSDCPHKYGGIEVSTGWGFRTNVQNSSYTGCDQYGCSVSVSTVATVFGVSLMTQQATSNQCPNSAQPNNPPATAITVTIQTPNDPEKEKFTIVNDRAKLLEEIKTYEAQRAAEDAKLAADAATAALQQSTEAAKRAVESLSQHAKIVQETANKLMASRTAQNLTNYNTAVTNYNTAAAAVQPLMVKMSNDYQVANGAIQNAQAAADKASEQNQKIVDLQNALAASNQAYDQAQVAAKLAGAEALAAAKAAADAALAAANAQKQISSEEYTKNTTVITTTTTVIKNTNTTIQNILKGSDLGTPETPSNPGGGESGGGDETPTPYCTDHPEADSCKPDDDEPTVEPKTGGDLPSLEGSWYEKKYPDGMTGVFTSNFNTIKNKPLANLINQLVPTIPGGAHSGCFTLPVYMVGNMQLCIPQIVMQALGIFMILTALFAARAIVFGG